MQEPTQVSFETPELSGIVLNNLYAQQKANRFCDLTLHVGNKIFRLHRNVLATNSPYFDSILKQHKTVKENLTVSCLTSETFELFLTYIYTGKITINMLNVEEILKLSNHFIVNKLIDYCTEFLDKCLNINNSLFILDLAQKYKLKNISHVDNLILSKLNDVLNGCEILNLTIQKLQSFIKYEAIHIPVAKQLDIFAKWINKDKLNREKEFQKLLNSIHWINIDHNEISKHLDTCILYTTNDKLLYYTLSTLIQNNILLPNYKNRYEELHYKYTQGYEQQNVEEKGPEEKMDCVQNENKPEQNITEEKSQIEVSDSQNTDTEIGKKNNVKMLVVRTKQKSYKQRFIRRLMLYGLRPNLRVASMKNVFCKKKISVVNIRKRIEEVYSDEKFGVKCPICFTVINDSLLLEQHLALSHAKDVTYKCGICTFVCQYHGDYLTHMKNHFPGPPYKCDYCDHETDQISKLLTHRTRHSDEMVYQCTFCSFKCRVKQNLLAHLKLHTSEKQHKCDTCGKSFRFKHSLEQHMMSHTTEKTLTCDTCGFSTKFLSHMIAHKRMHSGDVYRCSFPHCKYSTAKKTQLTTHSKTHTGTRPHNCNICGRGFMEKSHLVRHERIHLDEKPFKCGQCDYASSRRDKLKEHFTRHHGENASAKVPYKARPLRNASNGSSSTATTNTNTTNSSRNKNQQSQESPNPANSINFPPTSTNTPPNNAPQQLGNEIQDLIMHHQNHPTSTASSVGSGALPTLNHNYHHFPEASDFHAHHGAHGHALAPQLLGAHAQRPHQPPPPTHHMLARGAAHSTSATSTAAAVAAAMMLDPRFHHNGTVPYHPNTTPVSMAMAAVQSSQQIQGSSQHGEYPPSLQNCMTLF